jgi:hypothetical protein
MADKRHFSAGIWATVSRNAPINISLEPVKFTGFEEEKLHCLFVELEFTDLINYWRMGGVDSIPRRACAP